MGQLPKFNTENEDLKVTQVTLDEKGLPLDDFCKLP